MGFARAADVPVVLIGDIDRGGVIASLVGHQGGDRCVRCRADPRLSRQQISRRSDVVRRRHGDDRARDRMGAARPRAVLPGRPAVAGGGRAGARRRTRCKPNARIKIAVPILPHIANFDDLDPLDAEPAVDLVRVRPGHALPGDADLVILLGAEGNDRRSRGAARGGLPHRHRRACAARRQRARTVRRTIRCSGAPSAIRVDSRDPPAPPRASACLTWRQSCPADKRLEPVHGATGDGIPFSGYEMHMGVTDGPDRARPVCAPRRRLTGGRGFSLTGG